MASWLLQAPVLWLLLGTVLLSLALLGIDSDGLLLIGGITALALSLAAAALPLPPLLALILFLGLGGAGYAGLRRWSRAQRPGGPLASGQAERAVVISGFGAGGEADWEQGRVRWQGQSWAAVNLQADRPLRAGVAVVVMGRDGIRLQVLPGAAPAE